MENTLIGIKAYLSSMFPYDLTIRKITLFWTPYFKFDRFRISLLEIIIVLFAVSFSELLFRSCERHNVSQVLTIAIIIIYR
jgi:hypothetical protein